MYEEFIERYFGNNKSIVEFANYLIAINNKQALKELNKVVKVLDIDRSFKKAEDIITKIQIKYKIRQDDPIAKGKRKMGEKSERDNDLSEDNLRRATDNIQEMTDEYIKSLNQIQEAKEKDILD